MSREGAVDLFWAKVAKGQPFECWPWIAAVGSGGYGTFTTGRVQYKAHRYAYLLTHGAYPPAGQVVRHTCDNPGCCNPSHLVAGTQADNLDDMRRRGRSKCGDYRLAWTHCPNGHEYTPENTRVYAHGAQKKHRVCRTCYLGRMKRGTAKRRAAAAGGV